MAKSLNGRWYSITDPAVSLFIDKTYKKGYVTGFKYRKLKDGGEIHAQYKGTYEELQTYYTRTQPRTE
jgi:hypothetical protein